MTQEAPFALECFPTRVLDFRLEDGANPVECVLHLTNKGTEPVAFKVKTTKPKRYLVRPNQGTVGPSTNINVSIVLLAPEKMELLREFRNSSGPTETNKFMVQALPLDAGANVVGVLTSDAWEQSKERVQQKRLVVNFSVPQAAGPWTKMARLKEASNEIREAVTGGSSLDGAGAAEGSRRQGTGVDSGSLSQDQMWEQAKALRQKYDDLVSFTINLTAEKDLIQKSLASTRGELQREQQARKQLEAQLMDPAARRASAVVGSTTLGESHSGFSLFFVLLVAMIALFAGQYAAANGIADVFGK